MKKALSVLLVFGLGVALVGCSNYQFKDASRPDGQYDVQGLIAAENERGALSEDAAIPASFLPLVSSRRARFHKESSELRPDSIPDLAFGKERWVGGYRLWESRGAGPLDLFWENTFDSHYNQAGEWYETTTRTEVLAELWSQRRTVVVTPHGPREEVEQRVLFGLLPVYRTTLYPERGKTATQTAGVSEGKTTDKIVQRTVRIQ